MNDLATLKEFLPFIIPLVIVQFSLLGYTLYHILTHDHYKRGNRAIWMIVAILLSNCFIGPILYFVLGKEEA